MENGHIMKNRLVFQDVNVKVQKTHVLHNVCGKVDSGEMLAVVGPSGSGKTTLLNSLIGVHPLMSGEITLNGKEIDKWTKRGIAYVTQCDVFFSSLTLWDCLYFVAMIRLPDSMSKTEKIERLNYIVDLLELRKCLHTVIGTGTGPGLSGGEKKRANIGCELLTNPDIMFLDEPTSGLDASTAANLMTSLQEFAEKRKKIVIVTIHQPSSKIFRMFNSLLLLIDGHNAYFGPSKDVLDFFKSVDLHCEQHYNPADFILEQAKKSQENAQKLIGAAKECRKSWNWAKTLSGEAESKTIFPGNGHVTSAGDGNGNVALTGEANGKIITIGNGKVASAGEANGRTICSGNGHVNIAFDPCYETSLKDITVNIGDSKIHYRNHRHWPTSTWTQYKWISWRLFKHFRKRLFSPIRCTNDVVISIAMCLLWFQIDRNPSTAADRLGYFFLVSTLWSFSTLNFCVGLLPEERTIFKKERAAGYYKFFAYHLARITSELPILTILPLVLFTCQYWIVGLKGPMEYVLSLLMLLLHVYFVQAFSFLIGTIFDDFAKSTTFGSMFVVFGIIFGGFYGQAPWWMSWAQYCSCIFYVSAFMSILELSDFTDFNCANSTMVDVKECMGTTKAVITAEDVLASFGIDKPIYFYPIVLGSALVVLRIVGYYNFKLKNK